MYNYCIVVMQIVCGGKVLQLQHYCRNELENICSCMVANLVWPNPIALGIIAIFTGRVLWLPIDLQKLQIVSTSNDLQYMV